MKCSHCGNPRPEGYAYINDLRYCHSDNIPVSCYQLAMWEAESDMMEGWFDGLELL